MAKTKKLSKRSCTVLRALKPSYGRAYANYPIGTIRRLEDDGLIESLGRGLVRTTDAGWKAYMRQCVEKK